MSTPEVGGRTPETKELIEEQLQQAEALILELNKGNIEIMAATSAINELWEKQRTLAKEFEKIAQNVVGGKKYRGDWTYMDRAAKIEEFQEILKRRKETKK